MASQDSFNTLSTLDVGNKTFHYYSLPKAAEKLGNIDTLPVSLKVLLENLLRFEDGETVSQDDIQAMVDWLGARKSKREINYRPARVLMQDFTGVPAVVDLAAMRDAVAKAGLRPDKINPLSAVDLVIDHSVMVDRFGTPEAFEKNVAIEMERNKERYEFLRWGQKAFDNFRVVPPGTGICHQVNLEYLAKTVWTKQQDDKEFAYPDTLVGTDSHTTMINALSVLGWGVGGIEAEAAMLGQPISMLIPEVVGFRLSGKLREGVTATDLVLTVTQMLRVKGVVGKFVEFYGPGLNSLPLADRATIANMAPEYGATCGFFPVDEETLTYMRLTGREEEQIALVEAYSKAQGTWRDESVEPSFSDTLELDMGDVEPSLAGPKRPQDRVSLSGLSGSFDLLLQSSGVDDTNVAIPLVGSDATLTHGDVVIAAITSCTNTSNPSVMMAAGLVAKKALAKGLQRKPWVKSSLAPGSKVVTDYLNKAGLNTYLDELGFDLVGYGCTTCIGNSGPLPDDVSNAIDQGDLVVSSVLSGNRNFEGRIHPQVKANWLASPPLVVAYALAGTTRIDLSKDPIANDRDGNPVYLKDIWPTEDEIQEQVNLVASDMFRKEYGATLFEGDEHWRSLNIPESLTYDWKEGSTYVANPPFFEGIGKPLEPVQNVEKARVLAVFGDSITTDHISPAGAIKPSAPAGRYLQEQGVDIKDFNSYGSRRGNHEVMMRGTFANIRIRNLMVPGSEGGVTRHVPSGEQMSIYDAAMRYQGEGTPLVVFAGKEYGTGSSRDWAAKGTRLLGVKAVVAESFERIHRSNLVGMGVLPLQFLHENTVESLGLTGDEVISLKGLSDDLKPRQTVKAQAVRQNGEIVDFDLLCRIDTINEVGYFKNGGILQYVLRQLIAA